MIFCRDPHNYCDVIRMAIRSFARRFFRDPVGKRLCAAPLKLLEFLKNPSGTGAKRAIRDQKD